MNVRLRRILGDGQAMLEEVGIDVGDAINRDWEGTVGTVSIPRTDQTGAKLRAYIWIVRK